MISSKDTSFIVNGLKDGRVFVLPTDTVYGLICNACDKSAVERVFNIKKRKKNNPIPLFIKDLKMAEKLAKIGKKEKSFLEMVWPGKVTVILNRKRNTKIYGVKKDKIALRIPDSDLIKNISKKIDFPLCATSANISKKPAAISAKEVKEQLLNQKHQPDMIVDGGKMKERKSSLIFDLTVSPPKILRQ